MSDQASISAARCAPARVQGEGGRVRDYFALLKPRVMSLVVFTSVVGLVLAPGNLHPFLAFIAIACIAIGAGASGALNMWYEADLDAMMDRTRERPIPAGRIEPGEALGFGASLAIGSVIAMGLLVNLVAAGLLALTILYYAVFYTIWLKRRTPQNIVIGGAAGALPPVIGWAAVTGALAWEPWLLFAITFMWTPPHFWALALCRTDEYEEAGVPMMPNVAGVASTKRQILIYSLILAPLGVTPYFAGIAGPCYGFTAALLGVGFVWLAWGVYRGRPANAADRLFGFSILYLFLLFATLLVENLLGLS